MLKRFSALLTAVIVICSLCGCNNIKLDKPVFTKSLIYSEEMDFAISYFCDKDWDKTIKSISVPGAAKEISCSVYSEEQEGYKGIIRNDIEWGINFDKLINDNGSIDHDFTIDKIEVEWSDGSKSTEDIGQITVMGETEQIDYDMMLNVFIPDDTKGKSTIDTSFDKFIVKNKDELANSGVISRFNDCFETSTINGMSLDTLVNIDKSVEVPGNSLEYEYKLNKDAKDIYNTVEITLLVSNEDESSGQSGKTTIITLETTDLINIDKLLNN